jgi:hypothetical protein
MSVTDEDMGHTIHTKPRWWLILIGLAIVLAGAFLAQSVRTADGTIVRDIRFKGTNGKVMSALLYVPKNATPAMWFCPLIKQAMATVRGLHFQTALAVPMV